MGQAVDHRLESQTKDHQNCDEEDITPVKSHPPPKPIDFLSTLDDKHPVEDDQAEAMIREQLRLRNLQHKPMLGLDSDDDSDDGQGAQANPVRES